MAEDDAAAAANDDNAAYDSNGDPVCKVYDKNDFFTLAVQLVLAFLALGSLYFKRLQEVPRRNFQTWFLDISKQAIGACYAHVLNMIVAAIISQNIRGESKLEDQCAWYGISYIIDTSLGLVIAIVMLRWLDTTANARGWKSLQNSGVYAGNDAIMHWMAQCLAWLFILSVAKVVIYVFMWIFSGVLAFFGAILFKPLQGNIHFELVFVMILFPGFLNVIYFWIADGYLKAKKEHSAAHEPDALSDKRESLVDHTNDNNEHELGQYAAAPWSSLSASGKVVATTASV